MYLTNNEFYAIKKALELLPDNIVELGETEQSIIVSANNAIDDILRKKSAVNQRTAAYIAEKRKTNKDYARSKRRNTD